MTFVDAAPQPTAGRGRWRQVLLALGKLAVGILALILTVLSSLVILATLPGWPVIVGLTLLVAALAALWWLSRRAAIGVGGLLGFGLIWVSVTQLGTGTPAFADTNGTTIPGSVTSLEKVSLGGADQWLMIRGRSAENPVLLYLAGGPGGTQYTLNRQYNAALEDHFVVVNWEQRGSGKSGSVLFSDWGKMTREQYVADGLELTAYLRERFGQDRIYLLGQSWGTMLGVWMVQERPEWFAAYVGVGQMVSPVRTDTMGYDYVLDRARSDGDEALIGQLEANGPPPYHGLLDMLKYQQLIGRQNAYEDEELAADPQAGHLSYAGMTEGSEYGVADTVATFLGLPLTFARVYDQLDQVDLATQATHLEVPVYLVEGRHDLNSFPTIAEDYFNVLEAPRKQLVWFEHSGHNPMHEEADAFNDFMVNTVLSATSAG